MRIATWNVNSIRARDRRVLAWLAAHRPEVALLQETKCDDDLFAETIGDRLVDLGYEWAHHGRDHWNGVAILSRVGIADVRRGFPGVNRPPFDEARLVSATCGGVDVHSLYAPNGRTVDDPHYLFKLVWLERLRTLVDPDRPAVLAGDFNVAPTDTDVDDPRRFRGKTHTSEPEREAIRALLDSGLVDVTRSHLPHPDTYTWWGYRPGQFDKNRGLRIDLALCTPPLAARVTDVWIDTGERADDQPQKPSDHAPVALTLT